MQLLENRIRSIPRQLFGSLFVAIDFAFEPPRKPEPHRDDKADGEQAEQSDVSGEKFFEYDVHGWLLVLREW
jgi:hypothetical protein